MKKSTIIGGILAATLALPTAAQVAATPWYLGAGLTLSRGQHPCVGLAIAGATCDDSDSGFKLYGGYRMSRFFALEAGVGALGNIQENGAGTTAKIESKPVELSILGSIPVTNQFAVFGRIGGYRATTKMSGAATGTKTSGNATYGVGMDIGFTSNIGGRIEYQRYQNVRARNDATALEASANYNALGASLIVRF